MGSKEVRGGPKKAVAIQYALFPLIFLQVLGRLWFFKNYLPHDLKTSSDSIESGPLLGAVFMSDLLQIYN